MRFNQLDTQQGNTKIILTINSNLPTPAQVKATIESDYWPDVLNFILLAVSIGCITFLLGKLAG